MIYLFIDESGDIGLYGSDYLIIVALLVKNDYNDLNNIIKNMRRHKYKKQLKKIIELKGYDMPPEIIKHSINKLNNKKEQYNILVAVLNKENISNRTNINNNDLLYDTLASEIAKLIKQNSNLEIYIDKSKTKNQIGKFNEEFKKNLDSNFKVSIIHENSTKLSGLQFADIIAWSYFQK
ncbi:DUF3800 domain-containing protein [Methanobrevibacter sp. DSM 116169]|uniref:DUF3800 domain-containing protein n=1 Tax=Methanobrevibacter sp. DSM 116169 TaxID=3242727 RepID=UPI0038FCEC93